MTTLDEISTKIRNGQFELSQHATDQSIIRHISVQEVREAIEDSEVIEDYPNDRYGPRCNGPKYYSSYQCARGP